MKIQRAYKARENNMMHGLCIAEDEQPQKKSARQMWSKEEEAELHTLFKKNLDQRKTPRLKECRAAIAESKAMGGTIHRRPWETIKKKVNHMVCKLR